MLRTKGEGESSIPKELTYEYLRAILWYKNVNDILPSSNFYSNFTVFLEIDLFVPYPGSEEKGREMILHAIVILIFQWWFNDIPFLKLWSR